MTKKKKKIIIVVSLVAAVVIALTVTLCVIFIPRKLTNVVPTEGITKVTYKYRSSDYEKDIGEENLEEFKGYLSDAKYRFVNGKWKGISPIQICIYYNDGDKMMFDRYRLRYYTGGEVYVNEWELFDYSDLYMFSDAISSKS